MIFNNEVTDAIWPKGWFTDSSETILRFVCRACQYVSTVDLETTEELTKREQWFAHCHECNSKIHVVN